MGKEIVNLVSKATARHKVTDDELEARLTKQLDLIDEAIEPFSFIEKVKAASLSQLGIIQGILIDKRATLRGQPSVIVGHETRKRMDELAPALLAELKRRKLTVKMTERTAEITG